MLLENSNSENFFVDEILKTVGLELMFSNPQRRESPQGITAVELARKLNLKIDIVRKKLKILQEKGLIRSIGINPKYWEFNDYNFQRMDENDPVYTLLCCFDDIDFSQYFNY
jgi:hypothetical protein